MKSELRQALTDARQVTLSLVQDLEEGALYRQYDPEFSPIAWHLGHVAWQEEWFVSRELAKRGAIDPSLDRVFDSFISPKREREHAVPGRALLFDYVARVRDQTLEVLEQIDLQQKGCTDSVSGLFRFIANHERQHAEIIATVRILGGLFLEGGGGAAGRRAAGSEGEPVSCREFVAVAGGLRRLGVDEDPDAWDNEQPGHEVAVAAFALQRTPVSAEQWLEFMQEGGYNDERLWTEAGNVWRSGECISAPLFWERRDGAWWRWSLGGPKLVDPELPVVHVSFHEAQAFARAFGARLPTEAEWETAASLDGQGTKRRYPWGDAVPNAPAPMANAGLVELDVARPGSFGGHAACGAVDLVGGVWEWVDTAFAPYPDFRPQAYRGYSTPWFDGRHRVARGGSYLTQLPIARATFRNWYLPELRQPALGLRLAKDG